ncbi:MAG: DUF2628 domain-containing protein [Gammaproteobacteria bacterium]|nr:DUF2628 domain-containing protein [Gammaproteobacteria bacterium]
MSPGNQFKVILEGAILPGFERRQVQEGLAELFHSSEEKMERLLQGEPVPLKKRYDRDQAAAICRKIRQTGAQCRFEEIPEEETASGRNRSAEGTMTDESGPPATGRDPVEEPAEENGTEAGPASAGSREQAGPDRLPELLNRYVGTNTAYYEHQFARFGNPEKYRFAVSWHWPAFFFFFFWALYRKLWFWAGINLTLSLGLSLFIQPGVLYLLWALVWPVVANYLYFRVASSRVQRAVLEPRYEARLDALGGVSRPAAGLGVFLFIAVVTLTGNHLTDRFVEQYGEQIQEVLPGSGSQIRGDGSMLENIVDRKSKLALTSLKLSYLGTSLKILLLSEDNPENRNKIAQFERQFTDQRILDSWGQHLRLEQQVERYVLKSAGPDMTFNTDDDILQLVTYQPSP